MDFSLSDEQQDFVAAIRDFCQRECGTSEQREKLTAGYTEAHRTGVGNYLTAINTPIGIGLNGGTSTGWFLGSGIEHQIGWIPNLTWKTEYRFSEFDWKNNNEFLVASGVNTGFFSRDKLYTQTVVSTLSYRFNFGGY